MGSIGDPGDETQPVETDSSPDHSDNDETQPVDSLPSSPSQPGKKIEDKDFDDFQFLQSTLPFVDTIPLEDVLETQFVNFAGETQVLDDADDVEDMGTQLLDDCKDEEAGTDGGETDTTEVLADDDISEDDSRKRVCTFVVDRENKLFSTTSKQDDTRSKAELDDLVDENCSSGSLRRDFTSVRAAALRASGLAARSMDFKRADTELHSLKKDSQSSKLHTAEGNGIASIRDSSALRMQVDQEDFSGNYNEQMKGSRDDNKCRVGSSTVRRLFMDEIVPAFRGPNSDTTNADGRADLPQFPACGNEMAGLSYVDSQEPGDFSQANALDFVDKFLKVNVMDLDQEVGLGRSNGEKSKPVSSAKGTHSLAKRTHLESAVGERGIYDWDDACEDEGGGEFFSRKKEAFFDNGSKRRRSFTQPQKLKHLDTKISGAVAKTGDKEQQLDISTTERVSAISKSGLHKSNMNDKTAKVTETKSKKNLTKELNKQLNIGPSDEMEATGTTEDMSDIVGFDTQMAAEAMEALCFGLDAGEHDKTDTNKGTNQGTIDADEGSARGGKENRAQSKNDSLQKGSSLSRSGVRKRNSKQRRNVCNELRKESSSSSGKRAKNVRKQCDSELVKVKLSNKKKNVGRSANNWNKGMDKVPSGVIEHIEEGRCLKQSDLDEVDRCHIVESGRSLSGKKRHLEEQVPPNFTPIAHRTRKCKVTNAGNASFGSREGAHLTEAHPIHNRRGSSLEKFSKLHPSHSGELENIKSNEEDKSAARFASDSIGHLSYRKGKRSHRKLSGQLDPLRLSMDLSMKKRTRSSARVASVVQSLDGNSNGGLFQQSGGKGGSGDATTIIDCIDGIVVPKEVVGPTASKPSDWQSDADMMSAGQGTALNSRLGVSPSDRCNPSGLVSTTPINSTTPRQSASPICMGDEYLKQSCRRNLSRSFLMKEISSLISNGSEPTSTIKYSRKRKDMASIRALFSHHLDEDVIKQQKKILARLGASVASSIFEATHFITDNFVRTRNMLEAIAFGKPVVTHLWLESCGQASCFIDERNYILRDAKKEKEIGFTLPVSLARACQQPLLQGQKVFITPNTTPGKEILASLVKAVHGLAVERIGRSALKDDKIPDDLLVISCEEDYVICVPFLEKGAAVYSSELLLNGIVTQKLEYERHRLFVDRVKRTRSTIWVKEDSSRYRPVTKCK
ncbi:uncharacterized protein LOC127799363 [Diospyros lotus]|uniref:uncharacterized protein LOC127799363 n=1 Tax=Diospyros lotus TaxID=55363 RepID=UPI00224D1453|nr:uncharacterized protein LOC127799363 [Diospyros lotus]